MAADLATVPAILERTASRFPEKGALYVKRGGKWTALTFGDLAEAVELFACGLLARGIRKGDRIGILAPNSPEWQIADGAALSIGAVTVPVYTSLTPEQAAFVLRDSGARLLVVAPESAWRALAPLRHTLPDLEEVVLVDRETSTDGVTFRDVTSAGRRFRDEDPTRVRAARREVGPEDLATIVYTSGTTGEPKGVMLPHRALAYNAETAARVLDITERDSAVLFLPLAHSFERAAELVGLAAGTSGYYAESIAQVADNVREVRPTILFAVPRLFEKIHAAVRAQLAVAPPRRQRLFARALAAGGRALDLANAGRRPGPLLAAELAFHRRVTFARLHARLGGRLRYLVSGGAPLHPEIARFFWSAGIPILEGYGLTEAGPTTNVNTLGAWRLGTVGRALPGTEIRIAEDGEVLARGPGVMQGYWKRPKDSAETVDAAGWLHTGDVGAVDADGFLRITGRKKDIIVKSNGKNVAPAPIEQALSASDLVAQAVVLGDDRPFCVALLVPDFVELRRALPDRAALGDEALAALPETRALLQRVVDAANAPLANYERVKAFAVLARELTEATGELTPTLKVKRPVVAARYAKELETLYSASPPVE